MGVGMTSRILARDAVRRQIENSVARGMFDSVPLSSAEMSFSWGVTSLTEAVGRFLPLEPLLDSLDAGDRLERDHSWFFLYSWMDADIG